VLGPGEVLNDQAEPIGVEPGHRVDLAQLAQEARADQAQQRVAGAMPEPSVHAVEAVQVQHHHRAELAVAVGAREGAVQPVAVQRAAGEPRDAVGRRRALEPSATARAG
jgi:hypothetical protein